MRRSRRHRHQTGLSLFPFLAVLICTMGVLIVLLVLVTQQANQQAIASADERSANLDEQHKALRNRIERESLRANVLAGLKPEVQKRLAEMRLTRSHMEDQIRQQRQQAQRLEQQLELLERDAADVDLDSLRDELAAVIADRERAEQQVAEARRQVEATMVTYAVMPYRGPNSTLRRPIYLECKDDSIVLQPHGIRLTAAQFTDPVIAGNPLDAALLAVREYWLRFGGLNEQGEPYPLIIVRPSGADAYALVRHAMKSWDDEFGYELIDEELPLTFPGEDPALAAHLREVIAEAEIRQARMHAALANRRRIGNSRSGGAARIGNGSLVIDQQRGGFTRLGNAAGTGIGSTNNDSGSGGSGTGNDQLAERRTGGQADTQTSEPRSNASRRQVTGQHVDQSRSAGTNQGNSALGAVAEERGSGWALPSKSPDATGYRKPIRITLSGNYLVVHSGSSTQVPDRTITLGGRTQDHVDELVDAVWTLIDGWGFAGYNAYWKPELHVAVIGNGDGRFHDLDALFRESGLELKRVRR